MMNDPEYFERWRYTDTINVYNRIIEELQKLYDITKSLELAVNSWKTRSQLAI
jgi:hypothetical protein